MEGDVLLSQLREGWSPLPTKTVVALVLGGLRVRMTRSVVTMMSIVFAIAFLTYTGITNQLTYNVADAAMKMERFAAVDTAQVDARVKQLLAADPLEGQAQADKLALADELGFDEIDRLVADLPNVAQKLRIAQSNDETLRAEFDKLKTDPTAGKADLTVARTRADLARRERDAIARQHEEMSVKAALGQWVKRGGEPSDANLPARLDAALRSQSRELIEMLRSPSQIDADQMKQVRLLVRQAGQRGADVAVLEQVLSQEATKRDAGNLRNMLRRAGVNIEMTLKGNPLDTWLITMAMLTCAVGIANAMLMSVTERFREIGTMKCLGAQDGLVVKLFLLESAFLGVIGAAMGIVLGLVVAVLAALLQFGSFGAQHFPVTQGLKVVALSVLGGIVLAVVGAVYPAFAASRMKPVDALRVDE
jgi:hypothetical protein